MEETQNALDDTLLSCFNALSAQLASRGWRGLKELEAANTKRLECVEVNLSYLGSIIAERGATVIGTPYFLVGAATLISNSAIETPMAASDLREAALTLLMLAENLERFPA